MLTVWSKINHKEPISKGDITDQIIWLNSFIKINKNPIKWSHWIRKGILTVSDIWNDTNKEFRSYTELGVNWLELHNLICSIPPQWKYTLNTVGNGRPTQPCAYDLLFHSKTVSRQAYNMLIFDENALQKYWVRWLNKGLPELSYQSYVESFNRMYRPN